MYLINLEVSAIPKEKIKQLDNGKKFLNLVLLEMKQPDKYGNTHTVAISQTKEEREAKVPSIYVGKAKATGKALPPNAVGTTQDPTNGQNNGYDEIPF